MFVCRNFCPYWADFPPYHNRSFACFSVRGQNIQGQCPFDLDSDLCFPVFFATRGNITWVTCNISETFLKCWYSLLSSYCFSPSSNLYSPPRWCRGSGLDCGSDDLGLIPGIPSPCVGPLMARRLKTSLDVPVPVSG